MRGLLIRLGVVALTALALSPAAAQASSSHCPQGALCVWTGKDFKGQRLVITHIGVSNVIADVMNNEVSSVKNHYKFTAWLYEKRNAEGGNICLQSGGQTNLGGSFGFNNEASPSRLPDHANTCI